MGLHHKANIQLLIEMSVKKRPLAQLKGRFFLPKLFGGAGYCPKTTVDRTGSVMNLM